VVTSRSKTERLPLVFGDMHWIILIIVVFPAPFGPRKPNISPCCTEKLIESTAVSEPYVLVSVSAQIIPPILTLPWSR